MSNPTSDEFDALTRKDFNVFVERAFFELNGSTSYSDNFHIAVMCAELEVVRKRQNRRLALALPPRSLKSLVTSVAYPAWLLGHDPTCQIICASYGQTLADSLARDCRQIMMSSWYRRLFPAARLLNDNQPVAALATAAGGIRRATSVGGVLTGFGADVIIVDDPMKPEEAYSNPERTRANAWARHSLFTRLNDKANGAIILVMQRLHEDDMIGHVAEHSDLKIVSFPAIAQQDEEYRIETPFGLRVHRRRAGEALHPEREPIEILQEIHRAIGSRFFAAQYLQMPAPPGGSIVKGEWFSRYDPLHLPDFDSVFQSWDTASRGSELADYSVCTTWGRKGLQLFLLNVLRKRLEYPDLKRAVVTQAELFGATTVLIEDAASGVALIQDLNNDGFNLIQAVKPKGDKIIRFQSVSAMIEAGRVFIPNDAPWLEIFLHELTMFPATMYFDQVDSTSQALSFVMSGGNALDRWIEILRQRSAEWNQTEEPSIRVNYPDIGMQFCLFGGRQPTRDADGSFLMTREEFQYLPPGVYRVED